MAKWCEPFVKKGVECFSKSTDPGERLTEEDAPDTSGVLQPAATGERLQGDIHDVIANISQKVMADHGALRESDSPAPPEVLAAATTGDRLHADSSGFVQPAASGETSCGHA